METLSLMLAAVLVSLAIGIPAGVLAGRSDRFEKAITPVLDAMQIVPAFAYLMPVVIFFSVGNPAAVIATVVYAVPPAVRITALGIRGVARESVEMAESLGATRRQVLFGVQLPLALQIHYAGCEPDDHDGAIDRDHRLAHRRRRSGRHSLLGPQSCGRRARHGGQLSYRHHGHSSRSFD